MPSVGGHQRHKVILALLTSATASGALAGATAAVLVGPVAPFVFELLPRFSVSDASLGITAIIVAVGLLADLAVLILGRPRPFAVGRQVPREWIDLLEPPTVALLFGARLGIGPLTILSTWGWWSSLLAAGLLGVVPAIVVGATFGFIRLVVIVALSLAVERGDRVRWFGGLRRGRQRSWLAISGLGVVALASTVVGGCSFQGDRPTLAVDDGETVLVEPVLADGTGNSSVTTARLEPATDPRPTDPPVVSAGDGDPGLAPDRTLSTNPAILEDFVREPAPSDAPPADLDLDRGAGGDELGASADVGSGDRLATVLTADIDGFEVIAGPEADRPLDLVEAAAIQPDPTEEIALLETRGYRAGWTRAFRNADNDVAVASVYEFESAAQAEFYLEDGLITIGGYGGSFFDIEGLPGVRGFAQTFTDGDEELVSLGAAFQAGPRWYLLYLVGSPETVTPDVLVPAILDQRNSAVPEAVGG